VLGEVRSIVGRTHIIEATYLGGGGFGGSSAEVTETVSPGGSGGMVIGAPTVAGLGQAAMLSATVAAVSPQSSLPTGSIGARGAVAVATGPTIRARHWRARTAGAGSDRIDIRNERSGDVTDEALDRLAGSVNGKHAVDDEDIKRIAAARLVRNPGRHGGRSVDGVGLEPATRPRSRALAKPLSVHG
jgi:hypothetical protein